MKIMTGKEFKKRGLGKEPQVIPPLVERKVAKILSLIRRLGDRALVRYTAQFDGARLGPSELQVRRGEFDRARKVVPSSFLRVMDSMIKNVERYQRDLLFRDWIKRYGRVKLGSLARPFDRVGVYIPGGTAPLVSTVIMTVVPAKIAGVKEVIVATPPDRLGRVNPYILAACERTGASLVYKMGGAQAIGALAFGTQTVPRVDKIAGPGNIYVACAKRQVYGFVGVDMVAGPSEVLVIADDTAKAKFVAADLLAQAEHDERARTFLVTPSRALIKAVEKEMALQIRNLNRSDIALKAMQNHGIGILVKDMEEAADIANEIAPEHVEILCRQPLALVKKIRNAGAIFVGDSTPEPVGDYVAGPSHVLPTGGSARFFSPLSSRDFLKAISLIQYDRASLKKDLPVIQAVADIEGLDAHRKSAEARFTPTPNELIRVPRGREQGKARG